jgi:predicted RNase H-like nuclease (RuvC/YqgF family)
MLDQAAVDTALTQVESFLKRWVELTDSNSSERTLKTTTVYSSLIADADKVCDALEHDVLNYSESSKKLSAQVVRLTQELQLLESDIETSVKKFKSEEEVSKKECACRLKNALERAKKSVAHNGKEGKHH